ncbi:MAG: rhodanese-like domain-containing protein, partial [Xanthomonadales bacterium]|nr:rhodanese-like domain-containing protein [Xanthomonadales bacterium]
NAQVHTEIVNMSRILILMLLALNSAGISLAMAEEPPRVRGDVETAAQAWNLIDQGALVIDVRRPDEFEGGHIEGAINIVHTDTEALAAAIGDDLDRPVVLYCGSGRRAEMSKAVLEELGYSGIVNGTGYGALKVTQP